MAAGALRAACTTHHRACDCREAQFSEDLAEMTGDRDEWKSLATILLRDMTGDELARLLLNMHRELRRRTPSEVPF